MSLIVTGSISIDTIDTPTGSVQEVVGGSSIYFTAAASFFGPVRLVGAVGEDFPDEFVDVFHRFGVDVAGLERRKGSKTFRWHGRYHEDVNLRDTISVELNVLTEALPPIPDAFKDSEYVFLAVTHPDNQLKLLDAFPQRKLVVADTIDLYINTARDPLLEVFKRIDGLIVNDSEAQMLTGEPNAVVAAEKLIELGPKFVVVKKGQHGAILMHPDGVCVLPAYPAKTVIDPTGAGDSFAGAFMAYLAQKDDTSFDSLKSAMAYGTVAASFTIEAFSVERLKQISRDDIDRRLDEFTKMLKIGA
ncbi:MAG: PfkB family carbohydrate kinase [Phycisphaeraceae bacterium]